MKKLFGFLALLVAFSAHAKKMVILKTVVTCQQEDGDQWYEIGIVNNYNTVTQAYVVFHDTDYGSSKLYATDTVTAARRGFNTVYQNTNGTLNLLISTTGPNNVTKGSLSIMKNETERLIVKNLFCYRNHSISFEAQ